MIRKVIASVFLSVSLLLIVTVFAAAQGSRPEISQMDMATPTPTAAPEPTPLAELPLAGDLPLAGTQSGTCPMMSGTGMDMGSMSGTGMGSMSGMDMGSMSGMYGMQGMSGMMGTQGMSGMTGMDMSGMSGTMTAYALPWYSDPWQILGWVLVVLVTGGIVFGVVMGIRAIFGRSRPVQAS